MTVSSTTVPRVQYSGNGSTTEFPITFPFAGDDHVIVLLVAADGTESTPAYTISENNVLCTVAPASGTTLAIYRQTPVTQEIDLVNHDSYDADVYEQALDLAVYRDQEIKSSMVQVDPLTPPGVNAVLPLPSAGAYLRWNDYATGLESVAQLDPGLIPISAYMGSILDAIDAADARASLGITDPSAFAATLLDDVDAQSARATLGVALYPPKYIYGLLASNNGSDADNDIDIAAGGCRDDSNTYDCTLSSALTKQLNVAWSSGNNAGGLFSGSKASSVLYNIFLIRNDSTGVIDGGFDTSGTGANKPAGWSVMRWLGYFKTNSSSNISPFFMSGGDIWFANALADMVIATGLTVTSTTSQSITACVPDIAQVTHAQIGGHLTNNTWGTTSYVMVGTSTAHEHSHFAVEYLLTGQYQGNIYYSASGSPPGFIPVRDTKTIYIKKGTDGACLDIQLMAVKINR